MSRGHQAAPGGRRIQRRYPLEPLAAAMGVSTITRTGTITPVAAALTALGVGAGKTRKEYQDLGVTERVAERLAIKAGFHPHTIWPDMVEHTLEDQRLARNAANAAGMRKKYHADAEYAERRRAARRQAYAESTGRAERAKARQRYREIDGAAAKAAQRAAETPEQHEARLEAQRARRRAQRGIVADDTVSPDRTEGA